jgi:hypothetical protein
MSERRRNQWGKPVPGMHQVDLISEGEEGHGTFSFRHGRGLCGTSCFEDTQALLLKSSRRRDDGEKQKRSQGCQALQACDRCAIAYLTILFLFCFSILSRFLGSESVMNALEI